MWKLVVVLVLGCSSPAQQSEPAEPATPVEPAPKQAPPPDPEPLKQPPPPAADLGQPTPDDLEHTGRPITTGRETQALIAWRKNEEGITAVKAGKHADASARLRDAVARAPQPAYFLNLCMSLYWEGKFGEALAACNAVAVNEPTPAVRAKAETMIARTKNEAARQGIDLR